MQFILRPPATCQHPSGINGLRRRTRWLSTISAYNYKDFEALRAAFARKRVSSSYSLRAFKDHAETSASLLIRCAADPDRLQGVGLALHAHAVKSALVSDRSVFTRLLAMYSAWDRPADRDALFSSPSMSSSVAAPLDPFSWNLIIADRVRRGDLEGARRLFDTMPDRNAVSWTLMIDAHAKHGDVAEAAFYFDRCPVLGVIPWTAMISGFVGNGLYEHALALFRRMLRSDLMPNDVTFSCIARACAAGGYAHFGLSWSLAGLVVKTGYEQSLIVCNSLITLHLRMDDIGSARRVFDEMVERDVVSWTAILDVYADLGDMKEARRIFDEMPERNEVSWSMMIARYAQDGDSAEALKLFGCMLRDSCKPNVSCLASVLSAAADSQNLLFGANAHCHVVKVGFESDVFVSSALIDLYCRCRRSDDGRRVLDKLLVKNLACWNSMIAGYGFNDRVEEAETIFKQMPSRNIISWNAMLSAYAQNECYGKVLETFDEMLDSDLLPSRMTFPSVLRACASLPSLERGKNLHGKVVKLGIHQEVFIGTALIDMYAKSGDIESSKKAFSRLPEKNEVSWTAMMQGLADSENAEESLILFEEMRRTVMAPTEPMFLLVLFACSHLGFIDMGFHYFKLMAKVYGIAPKEKHYTCLVDLLARAGYLREAENFISYMPMEPEANTWASLLSGCSTYGNTEIGSRAAKKLLELDKVNSASYVLLSNIYASAGRWKDVAKVRTLMRKGGLKKGAGRSWIQIKDRFHAFYSWDAAHHKASEIVETLELLLSEMAA